MDTMKVLTEVFRRVFDDETITLSPETTADDVEGWDSLSHAGLIMAVEQRMGVRFDPGEILTFRNVGDLARGIEARLAA